MSCCNKKYKSEYEDERLYLGRCGEYGIRTVEFDLSEFAGYGEGLFTLLHQRSQDFAPYIVQNTEVSGGKLLWHIDATDTACEGTGFAEIDLIDDGVILAKSQRYVTFVQDALGTPDIPVAYDQATITTVAAHAASAASSASAAAISADEAAYQAGFTANPPYIGDDRNWYTWNGSEYEDTEVCAEGLDGAAAGFGTPTATVDGNIGTPGVTVTASGPSTEKVFSFAFTNLKGEAGHIDTSTTTSLTGILKGDGANIGVATVDAAPTEDSTNPVQSGGTYDALALKAPLASPTLTGTPAAPTADAGTNTTQIATTAFVQGELSGKAPTNHASSADTYGKATSTNYGHVKLSDSTSSTSDMTGGVAATPKAVKAAYDLANGKQDPITVDASPTEDSTNPVQSGGVYDALALKAPLASPALSGTPTAPTASAGTNTTQIATTAFVAKSNNQLVMDEICVVKLTSLTATGTISGGSTFNPTLTIGNEVVVIAPAITADHVVLSCEFSNPSAVTGDWTFTTSTNGISYQGVLNGTTDVTLILGKSGGTLT